MDESFDSRRYPFHQLHHVFDAGANGVDIADVAGDATRGVNISEGRIFPTRHHHREIFLRRSHHPTVSRIDLVEFFEPAFPQNLEQETRAEIFAPYFSRPKSSRR